MSYLMTMTAKEIRDEAKRLNVDLSGLNFTKKADKVEALERLTFAAEKDLVVREIDSPVQEVGTSFENSNNQYTSIDSQRLFLEKVLENGTACHFVYALKDYPDLYHRFLKQQEIQETQESLDSSDQVRKDSKTSESVFTLPVVTYPECVCEDISRIERESISSKYWQNWHLSFNVAINKMLNPQQKTLVAETKLQPKTWLHDLGLVLGFVYYEVQQLRKAAIARCNSFKEMFKVSRKFRLG